MTHQPSDAGLGIHCDTLGNMTGVWRDELNLASRVQTGLPFTTFVDAAETQKAAHFIQTLLTQKAAFDWEMNVPIGNSIQTLHFAGFWDNEELMILAAQSRAGLALLNSEMELMRINNEQANTLRTISKELTERTLESSAQDHHLFDELSRVNNELSSLQRELFKKNIELEKLNAEKNQFLGMAAHDLRSPLGVIQSYSQFLKDDLEATLNQEQLEFLTTIQTSSQYLLHLINDLLDISAIESGRLDLDLQPVYLAKLLQRHVSLNQMLAEKKQIQIKLRSDANIPDLLLDPGKVAQVVNNLLSNAIKFSLPHTEVEVRLYCADDNAVVSVQDHGPGIPAEELGKLFKPFQKTSVKSTAGEKSTGLGLAIVRRIVTGHNGKIWVKSTVGQGSTFFFSFPMEE